MHVTGLELCQYILQARSPHVVLGVSPFASKTRISKAAGMLIYFLSEHERFFDANNRALQKKAIAAIRDAEAFMTLNAKAGRCAPEIRKHVRYKAKKKRGGR